MRTLKKYVHPLVRRVLGDRIANELQARSWTKRLTSQSSQEPEVELVRRFLDAGEVALDIGGYGATYTYAMSQKVGPSGSVYVFEPMPIYGRMLSLVIERCSLTNTTLVTKALADTEHTTDLVVSTYWGGSIFGEVHIASDSAVRQKNTVAIETTTLDIFADQVGITAGIACVKIDVEGFELSIVNGGRNTLSRSKPLVICEVEQRHCERYGHSVDDVFAAFEELGYSRHHYDKTSNQLSETVGSSSHNNHVFIHNSRVNEVYKRVNG